MESPFPTLADIVAPIDPPFAIESSGEWEAIGIGPMGLVLRYRDDHSVLRHLGQVLKFMPQIEYLSVQEIESALRERGVDPQLRWQG